MDFKKALGVGLLSLSMMYLPTPTNNVTELEAASKAKKSSESRSSGSAAKRAPAPKSYKAAPRPVPSRSHSSSKGSSQSAKPRTESRAKPAPRTLEGRVDGESRARTRSDASSYQSPPRNHYSPSQRNDSSSYQKNHNDRSSSRAPSKAERRHPSPRYERPRPVPSHPTNRATAHRRPPRPDGKPWWYHSRNRDFWTHRRDHGLNYYRFGPHFNWRHRHNRHLRAFPWLGFYLNHHYGSWARYDPWILTYSIRFYNDIEIPRWPHERIEQIEDELEFNHPRKPDWWNSRRVWGNPKFLKEMMTRKDRITGLSCTDCHDIHAVYTNNGYGLGVYFGLNVPLE
ncbi:hypothetical protein JW711_05155 [Candidatus Woesearchaeota archaeon]|nr:hypothetical protein [Candidatus Woesearchaeota archaeon]